MIRRLAFNVIFCTLAVFAASLTLDDAYAHGPEQGEPTARIVVSATGTVDVAPDMAVLTLSVLRQADTARAALDQNNQAMERVLGAMAEEGIEARDMQTSNFNIRPRFETKSSSNGTRKDPEIIGYDVSNTLTVRIRDLTALGRVLDRSVSLGVNNGGDVRFTNDDPSEAIEQARIRAMEAAMRKADVLTSTAGVELGKILEITEHSSTPRPQPLARAATFEATAAGVPVAAGENSYSVTVNIIYALEQ